MKVVPVITGIGLVTALGRSTEQTWQALLAGKYITNHSRVEPNSHPDTSRVSSLAIEAVDQAMAQSAWNEYDAAVICGTSKGPVETWLQMPVSEVRRRAGSSAEEPGSSEYLRTGVWGLADLSTTIAHHTGQTNEPRLTLSAACASGLHGLIRAVMMIQSGQVTRALVVAAEASVHPLFLGSFRRLGVLVPEGEICRPFDRNRHGFLMSDAAAAVCIEAANPSDPPKHFAAIDRFALGGDATHLTGSDPNGRVLKYLLRRAIADRPMDLIHAHGTGTISNDSTELAAIESVIAPSKSPLLFSHKAALGHSLGASGLVAVVLNCLSHQTGQVPPNINTIDPIPTTLRLSRKVETQKINHSLIHAAGFGGPTAVVTLRSIGD